MEQVLRDKAPDRDVDAETAEVRNVHRQEEPDVDVPPAEAAEKVTAEVTKQDHQKLQTGRKIIFSACFSSIGLLL